MGDVVELAGRAAPLKDDHEFIVDLARFAEGLTTEEAIRKKYHLSDEVWAKLGDADKLVEAIEDEKIRRIRSGASKREKAQLLVIEAPDILGNIMREAGNSPRHRIDASKTLDDFAGNGAEATPASDRFQITIVLNGDTEHYDKSISINPNDTDRFDTSTTPPLLAATAKNRKAKHKPKACDDGEPV